MGDNLLPWPWCRHILSIKVENAGSPNEPPKLLTGLYELQVHVQKHELLRKSKNDIYFHPRPCFSKTQSYSFNDRHNGYRIFTGTAYNFQLSDIRVVVLNVKSTFHCIYRFQMLSAIILILTKIAYFGT